MISFSTDRWWDSPPTFEKSMIRLLRLVEVLNEHLVVVLVLRKVAILFNLDVPRLDFRR